jgi:small subunit ribosomal protein S6
MRKYELVCILGSLDEMAKKEIIKKIKDFIVDLGGKIEKEEGLGVKKLAYRIKKQTEGDYFLFLIELDSKTVGKLDEKLKREENLLRYLLVRIK